MRRLTCIVLSLLSVLGLALAASPSATAGPPIPTLRIKPGSRVFGNHTVSAGATVRVFNLTESGQTLTAKVVHGAFQPGTFDTGNIAANGGRGSFVAPEQIGTYHFGSKHDPSVRGVLYVRVPPHASAIRAPAAQTVPANSKIQFVTKLVDRETGEPIVGAHVYLEDYVDPNARPPWFGVWGRTTGPTGHAAGLHRVHITGRYRWVYAGDAQHAPAISKIVTITVE